MKKILMSLLLLSSALYAGEIIQRQSVVSVSTNSATAINRRISRKELKFYNSDSTYDMYISTGPITQTNYTSLGAFAIAPQGTFIDDYAVYKSTWYVCASSSSLTGSLFILEKE